MALFDDAGKRSVYADSVAAHNRSGGLSVLVKVGHVHALCVLVAQLKDVAKLVAFFAVKLGAAFRALVAGNDCPKVAASPNAKVAQGFHMLCVVAFLAGSDVSVVHKRNKGAACVHVDHALVGDDRAVAVERAYKSVRRVGVLYDFVVVCQSRFARL